MKVRCIASLLASNFLLLASPVDAQTSVETGSQKAISQIQGFLTKLEAKDYKGAGSLIVSPVAIADVPGHQIASVEPQAFVARLAGCKFKSTASPPSVPGSDLRMLVMVWSCPTSLMGERSPKAPLEVLFSLVSNGTGVKIWNYSEKSESTNG